MFRRFPESKESPHAGVVNLRSEGKDFLGKFWMLNISRKFENGNYTEKN